MTLYITNFLIMGLLEGGFSISNDLTLIGILFTFSGAAVAYIKHLHNNTVKEMKEGFASERLLYDKQIQDINNTIIYERGEKDKYINDYKELVTDMRQVFINSEVHTK